MLLATAAPAWGGDAVAKFSRWFGRYQHGRVDLYAQVESGFRSVSAGATSGASYFRTEGVDELLKLLDAVVEEGGEPAARILFDASVYRADRDPARERRKFVQEQPWLLRRLSTEALDRLQDPQVTRWLRTTQLRASSPVDGADRRQVAARVVGRHGDRESTGPLLALLKDPSRPVRIAATRALGDLGDPLAILPLKALADDPDEMVRLEGLLSLELLIGAEPDAEHAELLQTAARKALKDRSWPVRLLACDLLSQHPHEGSLPALIRALKDEALDQAGARRRVRSALRATLGALTGVDFPSFRPEDWADWWERSQSDFRLSEQGLADVVPEQGARFFGIPLESDVVVFLLDVSGSMDQPVTGDPGGPTRLFIALRETRRCVEALEEGTRFNIVLFNDQVHPFQGQPVEKSPDSLRSVVEFLGSVHPDGGTDLFGALEHVLDLDGPNPLSGLKTQDLDTLVVLTDGMPSKGTVLIPDEILHQIGQANRPQRVAIHTVDAGGSAAEFLERLASENFGRSRTLRN